MTTITTDRYTTDNEDSKLRIFLNWMSREYDRTLRDMETEELNIQVEDDDLEDFSGCGDEER